MPLSFRKDAVHSMKMFEDYIKHINLVHFWSIILILKHNIYYMCNISYNVCMDLYIILDIIYIVYK